MPAPADQRFRFAPRRSSQEPPEPGADEQDGSSGRIVRDLLGGTVVGLILVGILWYVAAGDDAAVDMIVLRPLAELQVALCNAQDAPGGISSDALREAAARLDAVMTALAED